MPDTPSRKIKIACPSCGQKLDVTDLPSFSFVDCPACSFRLIVPKWFGNYLLEAPEGSGGMAVVYRALDIALDREVAIKVFRPELGSMGVSPDLFLHEARIAATINHPAVVPIYSCGEQDGSAYIVMEYMGGGTLESRLGKAGGRLPVMETCRWIRDVCEGLDAAGEQGIVHHDVKPANLLLDLDSNVKITDFGLSRAVSGKSAAFLDPSKMWLSPHYVSPEKVRTGEEGPAGDVYSLGATFYHLLSGQTPFRADDMRELVDMRLQCDPVPPDRIRPDITPALSSLILDMMDRNPEARPNYRQIVTRINEALAAIMRPAAPPSASGAPFAEPAAQKKSPRKVFSLPANRASSRRRIRSSHLVLLLILFFLMCSLCFLVFLPRFADRRALLDAAPALKFLYGDLPPESFPFLTEDFYDSPVMDADFAFSDAESPLDARYAAAWVSGVCRLLDDVPDAVPSVADMGSRLRSAASLAGTQLPPADAYCLAVLSRLDPNRPDVYFSPEQRFRVLLGRLVRSLYDFEPTPGENGCVPDRILSQFGELRKAFQALPEDSWLAKLYGSRLRLWESALSGDDVPSAGLEPLFVRLRSGAGRERSSHAGQQSGGGFSRPGATISDSPFGIPSSAMQSSAD